MERLRVQWSGAGVVGPGLTTFYFLDGTAAPGDVLAFFTALVAHLPDDVQITVPNTGDVVQVTTGKITGSWTAVGGGVVNGSSTQPFMVGAGYRIVWETNGVRNGRHVRGSTFMVPVVMSHFDSVGRLTNTAQTAATTAANNLIASTSSSLQVWSRPKGGLNGESWAATSARVPETPTALRSRRY